MLFYVNIFVSTEDGIAEKLLLFKIEFVDFLILLIILLLFHRKIDLKVH